MVGIGRKILDAGIDHSAGVFMRRKTAGSSVRRFENVPLSRFDQIAQLAATQRRQISLPLAKAAD
jgi:hypothetical protein